MAALLDAVCILLILLTPLSYLPLYRGLFVLQSTSGISVAATLHLTLCAQAQITTIYYLWACPIFKRDGDVVPKPPQPIDYLNLVQLLLQWICSLLLCVYAFRLAFVLVVRTRARTGLQHGTTGTTTGDATWPSNKTANTLLVLHASLCVFWAVLAGQPRDDWLDLPFVTIMGINQYCINPVITIMIAVAFAFQVDTTKETRGPSALNRTTLFLQAVVFLALAISWPFRMKVPQNRTFYDKLSFVGEWYALVGWPCINNAIIAIGQGIVLLYATFRKIDGGDDSGEERQPLLST